MSVINFFLSDIFHSEVMFANAFLPGDFKVSYRTSLLPFGIFRIEEKEKSPLWQTYNSPPEKKDEKPFDSWTEKGTKAPDGSQLNLF